MPIYDNDGTTNHEIGKIYDNDGTINSQIGKVYDNDGAVNSLIYTSEVALGQLIIPEFYNYMCWNSPKSADSARIDMRGCNIITFNWDLWVKNSWAVGDGTRGTNTLRLCDTQGYEIKMLFSGTDTLFTAGQTAYHHGTVSIDISGLSDAKKQGIYLTDYNVMTYATQENKRFGIWAQTSNIIGT